MLGIARALESFQDLGRTDELREQDRGALQVGRVDHVDRNVSAIVFLLEKFPAAFEFVNVDLQNGNVLGLDLGFHLTRTWQGEDTLVVGLASRSPTGCEIDEDHPPFVAQVADAVSQLGGGSEFGILGLGAVLGRGMNDLQA